MDEEKIVKNIKNSNLNIYDQIVIGDEKLWIPSEELQRILLKKLKGVSLEGLSLRTRSKVVKTAVCEALGYPVPKSFKKTKPRFPGQNFDTYLQKRNNLQIWNEDIDPTRRYVIFQISTNDVITSVRVVKGMSLAKFDNTGTLTQKYQARLSVSDQEVEFISNKDTVNLAKITSKYYSPKSFKGVQPTDHPQTGNLIPISEIYQILKAIVGIKFKDAGADQERNRGAILHRIVCEKLGYKEYADTGQFPDVRNQLLEVKLQMSPTIDLGLVNPDSKTPLDINRIDGITIRHCDVRYALFYARLNNREIEITNFYLTTGKDFFKRFQQFQGKVINKKRQMILPRDFFEI